MSIDRDTFEKASEAELSRLSVPDLVVGFLATHDDQAFEAREIARQIDADQQGVSTALTRLKERGLAVHKGIYWAATTDTDRLRSSSEYERATALFNDQLGEEDVGEWRERAPEKPHPSVTDDE